MKRTVKIISLCLCLTLFGLLFAGCDALDEAKNNHAFLSEDMETITFRGETYKLLPEGNLFYLESAYPYDDVDVTNEDVPVLLKDMFGYACDYYERNDIFSVWINDDFDVTYYSETYERFYCNEKDYQKYTKALEENKLDRIGFEYEVMNDADYSWYYSLDVASEEVSKEILDHIENPEAMTSKLYSKIVSDSFDSYCLQCNPYKCDSEGILATGLGGFDIYKNGSKAYLVDYISEKAVELSETVNNALDDKYFYGSYYYENDYIIGEADEVQVEYMGLI